MKNPFKKDTIVKAATKIGIKAETKTEILSATIKLKKKKKIK